MKLRLLLAALAVAWPAARAGSFAAPVGLQLYSLRAQFTQNVPKALELTRGLGFRDVELAGTYNLPPERFRQMLLEAGLNPVAGHFSYDRWKAEPEAVVREAQALGLKYAGTAWISHQAPFNEAAARDAVAVFTQAGEACARAGMRFFYHCHGYEFRPHGDGFLMDLLIRETDPQKVAFQMDTLWVFLPGQDPAAWLRKYPGRWVSMHLKDLKRGVERGSLVGTADPNHNVPLGQGQLDWPAILKAAQETGVKLYFIEDESALAPEQIPQSLKFLREITW